MSILIFLFIASYHDERITGYVFGLPLLGNNFAADPATKLSIDS